MRVFKGLLILLLFSASLFSIDGVLPKVVCEPVRGVSGDADDPAIWIHPTNPEKSLIAGTDKGLGIVIYNLEGKIIQKVLSYGRVNNVDTSYGFSYKKHKVDLFVANIRKAKYTKKTGKAMVLLINKDYYKNKKPPVKVLSDGLSENNLLSEDSYGFTVHQDLKTKVVYIFDRGKKDNLIRQFELEYKNKDIYTTLIRTLTFEKGIAEGFVTDEINNILYVPDDETGIYTFHAGPKESTNQIDFFDTNFYEDREGSALYLLNNGDGYYVVSDQGDAEMKVPSHLMVFSRRDNSFIKAVNILDERGINKDLGTDGIDIASVPLGPKFPNGIVVAHNRRNRNFLIYDWADFAGKDLIVAPELGVRR